MAQRSRSKTSAASRPSRQELQEIAAKRQRNSNLMLIGGGIVLAVIVGLILYANFKSNQPVGEEESLPTLGNTHIPQNSISPIQYNSVPPSSGPHYPGLAPWAVYREPVRYEQLLHNLEDGGVVIYYQCEDNCPELVDQLEAFARPLIAAGRHLVVVRNDPSWTGDVGAITPLHQDMGARIALVAWQRLDKLEEFDEARIRAFFERYEGLDHHAG
ncbi:MAG: DUF3105 domain-containing protein [Caldilineaceae bacterium]|nr:DUF3105 domain-containing protein [Caldilineaceae bacterium]